MKFLLITTALIFLATTGRNCKSKTTTLAEGCYQGRLEVKGPCMNYTISIIGGNPDTSRLVSSWKDEESGKTYKNVFALGSRCNFPDSIKQGDTFYFRIDSSATQNCAVCMIYYPVPNKKLPIKVLNAPCTP